MMNKKSDYSILIVDDEQPVLDALKRILLSIERIDVLLCSDSRQVEDILHNNDIKVIILDLAMPYLSGEEILPIISKKYPEIYIIIITASDDIRTAVRCIKNGASNFLVKPVDKNILTLALTQAIEIIDLKDENVSLRDSLLSGTLKKPGCFSDIITRDPHMKNLFKYMEAIAGSKEPVLFTGENGAGKELFVHAMYKLQNPAGDLITVNVSGLDDTLFSDTLFGHKKGAYTDAGEERSGLVIRAGGGILFLDEIGDLEIQSQSKLLRLIQNREYTPLGSDVSLKTDARIILATNKDIKELIKEKKFRMDLYYRLNTHSIHIPPLRERKDDIPLLINHFINIISEEYKRPIKDVSKKIIGLLSAYQFPGNVRELEGIIKNAVFVSSPGPLSFKAVASKLDESLGAFPVSHSTPKSGEKQNFFFDSLLPTLPILPTLKSAKKSLIKETYKRSNGNITVAAEILGITRQALSVQVQKLKEQKEID